MLDCRNISIAAGDFALTGIDLQVQAGQWATVMGSTGCGKTTLLEAICGLRDVTAGSIHIGGVDVTRLAPRSRGIGLVPQDGALFAGMRVEAMLALPLRARGVGRAEPRTACVRHGRASEHGEPLAAYGRTGSAAANASVWRWAARCCASRRCCVWTSRFRPSMVRPGHRCGSS